MSGLRNLIRENTSINGRASWKLSYIDGQEIDIFALFCLKIADLSFSTRERYAIAVSRFIDYLIESRLFDGIIKKRDALNILRRYPSFLKDGSTETARKLKNNQRPEDEWLARVAKRIIQIPFRKNSFSNTFAAINIFLSCCEDLEDEALADAARFGITNAHDFKTLLAALNSDSSITTIDRRRLQTNSMLGAVVRTLGGRLKAPRSVFSASKEGGARRFGRPFPVEWLSGLLANCHSRRDRLLFLLLVAIGIRISECLALRICDIDVSNGTIDVLDPEHRRFGQDFQRNDKIAFKGRATSEVLILPFLKDQLWSAYEDYMRHEFIPYSNVNAPDYLLQYVDKEKRGLPLIDIECESLNRSFRRTIRRAGYNTTKPEGGEWPLHSLRHCYGTYLLNDAPLVDGSRGIQLHEVQQAMGHKSIESTKHYARTDLEVLKSRLLESDFDVMGAEHD